MSQDLEAVRQSIDRITTITTAGQGQMTRNRDRIVTAISSSEVQMMRSIDQLAAGQERVAPEITKLQAVQPYILYKNSEPLRVRTLRPRPSAFHRRRRHRTAH
jgi:hypothetical protein